MPRILSTVLAAALLAATCAAEPSVRFDFTPGHTAPEAAVRTGARLTFEADRCQTPPKIDGRPGDAAWRGGPVLSQFGIPDPPTYVRFRYDDRALYVLVICPNRQGTEPLAQPHPRDAIVASEDQVHLCIGPDPRTGVEYLLRINAAGAIGDSRNVDDRWNGDWQHAVWKDKTQWAVELALPFLTFGLKTPPHQLGFNIGRRGRDVMIRSWNNAMHTSASASALVLQGVAPPPEPAPSGAAKTYLEEGVCTSGDSLVVRIQRSYARPQDRWIDAIVTLSPPGRLDETRLEAKLLDASGDRILEAASIAPPADYGRVSVDLRRHQLMQAELRLEYTEGKRRIGIARLFLSARQAEPIPAGHRVPVLLDAPPNAGQLTAWPVTFGAPFPAGRLWDVSHLRLVNGAGREIPSQKEITGRWAEEGSIQWVRFDALVNLEDGCQIEMATPSLKPTAPVAVAERDGRVELSTGVVRYVLAKEGSPIQEIWLGSRRLATGDGTRGLHVVDQAGRVASASGEGARLDIESRGPAAACVRVEGFYRTAEGEPLARHITRVEVFAGQPFANVTHTLTLTRDTNKVWFKEVGWEFSVAPGGGPRAIFNTARAEPAKTQAVELGDDTAWMHQDEHTCFGGGRNHFAVGQGDGLVAQGEECGDWAALAGSDGAMMVACRETARQHPKEFELSRDRFTLKLFSGRTGEELDFRSPTLARKWRLDPTKAEQVAGMASNAIGWAKTHELRVSPLPSADPGPLAARLGGLLGAPVHASVDPVWIAQSKAMGPLHPRDTDRFPQAEEFIDRVFDSWSARGHTPGHYGFVDYFGGPMYGPNNPNDCRRYKFTYGVRSSAWLVYARSGDRAAREFAEGTNKAYLDNYMAHWDTPGVRRGLFRMTNNDQERFPFYWGDRPTFTLFSTTNLDQFIWLYHLTGYRRAKDAIEQFAQGFKTAWKPGLDNRVIMVFRELAQAYALTHDPALRALAEKVFDDFTDTEAELLLTKKRQYGSSTYKTSTDVRGLIDGWRVFGLPKYHETAQRVSRFWWDNYVGDLPISYMNPWGVCGAFLYEETGDPAIASGLDFALRRASVYRAALGASHVAAVLEGLPCAMSVLARQSIQPAAPWVAYRDYGFPSSVVAAKGPEDALDLTVRSPSATYKGPGPLKPQFTLRPVRITAWVGGDLHTVTQHSSGAASVRVPKDAPAGAYEIVPAEHGHQFVVADKPTPMVLHAPHYWMPPDAGPSVPIYFTLPSGSVDAQIFFEGLTRLFDPHGQPFGDPDGVRGWVDLPGDRPGLWRFEPIESRLVRGRNFPPFFAFGRPSYYFEPPIEWQREKPTRGTPSAVAPDQRFVDGAVEEEGNEALYLRGKETLTFPAGPDHPSGDGGQFVPRREATVEFFFKPSWATFDLGSGAVLKQLVRILTNQREWYLAYRLDPQGVNTNLCPKDPSHSLFASMYLNDARRAWLRVWRTETLFERDEWVHVAWVWGPRPGLGSHQEKLSLMRLRIFLNGRGTSFKIWGSADQAIPLGSPKSLVLGPLDGAVDELRVSDTQRYTADFTPPPRYRGLTLDEHTRALFRFDGDLKGQSHGSLGGLAGEIAGR